MVQEQHLPAQLRRSLGNKGGRRTKRKLGKYITNRPSYIFGVRWMGLLFMGRAELSKRAFTCAK
jgi:hypothetical protein